ncbi:hypothetical protein [Leptospira yasudae]|uniref:hypothetical protein n=1 Tax=Leptospira yasudae TaxID=2202201 RepID=UPI0011C3B5A4|nr:hypothetical protein [Leptospira yasudae]
MKDKKPSFEDKRVQVKIVKTDRRDTYYFGRMRSKPKDPSQDFFVVEVLISNLSSENIKFRPGASVAVKDDKSLTAPMFIDYCCDIFEDFAGKFKNSFGYLAGEVVDIPPGETVLRKYHYLFPKGVNAKHLILFESLPSNEEKAKDLAVVEIVQNSN